jgi:hypothetical protein
VLIGGKPAARVGDLATCIGPPDIVMTGAFTVLVGGMPLARITDATAHGGLVSAGDVTVLVGGAAGVPGGSLGNALSSRLAGALTSPVGSGDASDVALVVPEVAKLPPHVLQAMLKDGVKVVVARGSVTDHLAQLKGVRPRGWPPGSTWDSVPGLYDKAQREVVIATIGHGTPAGAHVPATGEGHGCVNLVIHEAVHGYDSTATPPRSSSAAFSAARNADIASLGPYETQAGSAGPEETFAESAARYFGGDPTDAARHPNLHDYWKKH